VDHILPTDQVNRDSLLKISKAEERLDENSVSPMACAAADPFAQFDRFFECDKTLFFSIKAHGESYAGSFQFGDIRTIDGTALGTGVRFGANDDSPFG
jgi:hypothetical protein